MTKALGWQFLAAFAVLVIAYTVITLNGSDPEGLLRLVSILGGLAGSTFYLGDKIEKKKAEDRENFSHIKQQTNGNLDRRMEETMRRVMAEQSETSEQPPPPPHEQPAV